MTDFYFSSGNSYLILPSREQFFLFIPKQQLFIYFSPDILLRQHFFISPHKTYLLYFFKITDVFYFFIENDVSSAGKLLAAVFWDCQIIIVVLYLEKGNTTLVMKM